jgi:hypothetical protein
MGKEKNSQLVFLNKGRIMEPTNDNNRRGRGRQNIGDEKKIKKIDVRFTEDEYKSIIKMSQTFGLKKSELIRNRTLENTEPLIINGLELQRELALLGEEMGRSGNNINQLSKHANSLNKAGRMNESVVIRFEALFQKYNIILDELNITLRKVIRNKGKSLK